MSSITVNAVLREVGVEGTSSAGIAGEVDFPGRIIPPFPFALSTPTTINNFLSNTGDVKGGGEVNHLIVDQFLPEQQVQKHSVPAKH